MSAQPISRRTLLKGLGVTMALPLLEAMQPLNAWGAIIAQAAGAPKVKPPVRFAALYMAKGHLNCFWIPVRHPDQRP